MGIFDGITGKSLENKIDEFERVYGDVLVGLHRDVATLRKQVHDQTRYLIERQVELRSMAADLTRQHARIDEALQLAGEQRQGAERLMREAREEAATLLERCTREADRAAAEAKATGELDRRVTTLDESLPIRFNRTMESIRTTQIAAAVCGGLLLISILSLWLRS